MEGRPVWLASASVWIADRAVGTAKWREQTRSRAERVLRDQVLGPVGDPQAERLFRMNATLCLHRALSAQEEAALPASWHDAPATDLAGGPIEVLWENVPSRPSTRPCAEPRRQVIDSHRPDLWIPVDCGACEPCQARAAIGSYRPLNGSA